MKLVLGVLLAGMLSCRSAREESVGKGSDDRSNAASVPSSPQPIEVTSVSDAAKPRLVDDMIPIVGGKSRGRIPTCDKPPAVSAVNEPIDDSEYDVAAFQIDRRPVSCVDYEACIASGGCKAYSSRSACSLERASVTSSEAAAYCKWRGVRLPEYNEWQRAIRGAEGRVYVTGNELVEAKACLEAHRDSMNRVDYCAQATPEGVVFTTQNVNLGEWTQTRGCRLSRGEKLEGPVAAYTSSDRLDLVWVGGSAYEFRCARNL